MRLKYPLSTLFFLTWIEFRRKDQGTVMGIFWSLLYPFVMVFLLYLLFSRSFGKDIPNYPFYIIFGLILWNYFSRATLSATSSLKDKATLLKNTTLPPLFIILTSIFSATLLAGVESAVGIVFYFLFTGQAPSHLLVFLGLFLAETILIIGVSFFLCYLYLLFRDVKNAWTLCLSIGFFLVPTFYNINVLHPSLAMLVRFNPVAILIASARDALVGQDFPLPTLVLALIITLLFVITGSMLYYATHHTYAERI